MAELRSVSSGSKARAAEKKASANLRGRKDFNDQSNVNPIFGWINKVRENWSQPLGGWNEGPVAPGYDKYPKGSLTGKKKN